MKKSKLKFSLIVWTVVASVIGCTPSIQKETNRINHPDVLSKPYVILVSIDGYRYDYTDLYSPPILSKLKKQGAYTKGLIPVFPSKTFTNHYSIATGLFAENHGITANMFYDPLRKAEYSLSNRKNVQDGTWYGGVPLWVAAEQQGMLAANYFWPGSEADIQGVRPSYFYNYNQSVPLDDRVDQVIKWLELPSERRPHLITLYFSDVDSAGHKFGPESKEVRDAVLKVDKAIDRLQSQVLAVHLPVNIIIVSDHGMQEVNPNNIEYIDDYTNLKAVRVLGDGIQGSLYFNDASKIAEVYGNLKARAKHFKVFKRDEVPERYHYSKNPRCGDLVLVAEPPYVLGVHGVTNSMNRGAHGYDPDTTHNMWGIFYAVGPQIKSKIELQPFRNIHIYPLIMKILGLKISNSIDGNPAVLNSLYIERAVVN